MSKCVCLPTTGLGSKYCMLVGSMSGVTGFCDIEVNATVNEVAQIGSDIYWESGEIS